MKGYNGNEVYNGWTSYETWRIFLELFDGQKLEDFGVESGSVKDQAKELKEWTYDYIEENCNEQILVGWLQAFIEDVNFEEIVKHLAGE